MSDIRFRKPGVPDCGHTGCADEDWRITCENSEPVTVDDLIAALIDQGATRRQWYGPISVFPKGRPELGDDLPAGRYVIYRLADDE